MNKKINLILQGGGIKGLAYIGALRYLEEKNYQIEYISGTSIGAILGALVASGYNSYELENIIDNIPVEILLDKLTIKESIQNKKITCHFYDTSIIAKGAALYAKKQVKIDNFMVKYHYCLSIFDDDILVLSNLVPAKVKLPYTKTFHLRTRDNRGVLFNIYETFRR